MNERVIKILQDRILNIQKVIENDTKHMSEYLDRFENFKSLIEDYNKEIAQLENAIEVLNKTKISHDEYINRIDP